MRKGFVQSFESRFLIPKNEARTLKICSIFQKMMLILFTVTLYVFMLQIPGNNIRNIYKRALIKATFSFGSCKQFKREFLTIFLHYLKLLIIF